MLEGNSLPVHLVLESDHSWMQRWSNIHNVTEAQTLPKEKKQPHTVEQLVIITHRNAFRCNLNL